MNWMFVPPPPLHGGLATKSYLILSTPWTVICQAPLSAGFSRQEYWSRLPFPSPGDLPDPEIELGSPAWQAVSYIAGRFFTKWTTGEAQHPICILNLSLTVGVFEDEDFTKVIKVKWGHKGGIVVPRDYCPFKKSPERGGFSCIQRSHVCMMRWKSPASQAMRTQNENCAGKILILDSPALRTARKNFQFFKPRLWHFIMAEHANEYSNLSECAV